MRNLKNNLLTIAASNTMGALAGLLPKAISAVSMIGGALASFKLADSLLTRFFGKTKITATVIAVQDTPEKYQLNVRLEKIRGILEIFGQHRPYVTPVSKIVDQIKPPLLKQAFKNSADRLEKIKISSFVYARELVNSPKFGHIFDAKAKAEVSAALYVPPKL